MNDQNDNVIKLINMLSVGEEKKNEMIKKVQGQGVSGELIMEIRGHLEAMEKETHAAYPQESADWKKIQDDLKQEEADAAAELDQNLSAIDLEVQQVGKQASKELDQVEVDSLKQNLGKN